MKTALSAIVPPQVGAGVGSAGSWLPELRRYYGLSDLSAGPNLLSGTSAINRAMISGWTSKLFVNPI